MIISTGDIFSRLLRDGISGAGPRGHRNICHLGFGALHVWLRDAQIKPVWPTIIMGRGQYLPCARHHRDGVHVGDVAVDLVAPMETAHRAGVGERRRVSEGGTRTYCT